jgi:hypothetical protein
MKYYLSYDDIAPISKSRENVNEALKKLDIAFGDMENKEILINKAQKLPLFIYMNMELLAHAFKLKNEMPDMNKDKIDKYVDRYLGSFRKSKEDLIVYLEAIRSII